MRRPSGATTSQSVDARLIPCVRSDKRIHMTQMIHIHRVASSRSHSARRSSFQIENHRTTGRSLVAIVGTTMSLVACSGAPTADLFQACKDGICDGGADVATPVSADGGAEPDAPSLDAAVSSDASLEADVSNDGGDASTAAVSDPCPSVPLAANCSSTCGTGTLSCDRVSCHSSWVGPTDPNIAHVSVPSVLRTPDHPGFDPSCADACRQNLAGTPHRAFVMAFMPDVPFSSLFRVRVADPWVIQVFDNQYATFCPPDPPSTDTVEARGCFVVRSSGLVLIWTDDPNAPSKNISIDAVQSVNACP
jgi:hypothetical protein